MHSSLAGIGLWLTGNRCQSSNEPIIRFGLVTDSHYADREPGGTRYYRESLAKMQECVEVFNREKVDFAIHLGDFKDEDGAKNSADTLKYLQALEGIYAQFNGPRYHCVGNHDVDSITKQQFLANIENTGIDAQQSYYRFEQKGIQFIVLDGNFYEDGRDHFYAEGANWQDIRIPQKELDWLAQTLQKNNQPTIVFCHHPTFEYLHGDHVYHLQNYEAVQDLFQQSQQVAAVFHGHTHQDTYQEIKGIHYLTMLGMVDHSGPENNAYAIAELYPDASMEIIGYRRVTNKSMAS